ncbi:MAG: response regulator transcription factor [Flavipsychrobacter sp.]|nr:response regulator transcription factor [Flavipsychrobacter sp.]
MNYKAIIIDDEEMARLLLKEMVAEYTAGVVVADTCADLAAGVKSIRRHKPDIVFLDIELPGHSGLELLDFFNDDEVSFSVIFVTAYNKYAIQAFNLSAVSYLLKPVQPSALKGAIELFEKNRNRGNYAVLKNNLSGTSAQKIALHTLNSISFEETANILFFEADGAYTKVVLRNGAPVVVSRPLKYFETILSECDDFYRCHKSYMVNVRYVTEYMKPNGGVLIVDKKHEISVSNDRLDVLMKRVAQFQ